MARPDHYSITTSVSADGALFYSTRSLCQYLFAMELLVVTKSVAQPIGFVRFGRWFANQASEKGCQEAVGCGEPAWSWPAGQLGRILLWWCRELLGSAAPPVVRRSGFTGCGDRADQLRAVSAWRSRWAY
jgi:hypothetical protein